jgi:hypothetical protein
MKMQCNTCKTKFDQPNEHFVSDHTGFEGIYIDVCPSCISDNITEIYELSKEQRLLQMWADAFINKCIQNKQSTNDANLIIHYTNLISDTQILLKKILA